MSEPVRISDQPPGQSQDWFGAAVRFTAVNLLAAIACTILTTVYIFVGTAAGASSYHQPLPFTFWVFVSVMVIAVAVLGASVGRFTKQFPWLGAILTPLSVNEVFRLLGARDILSSNVTMGCIAAGILLAGAAVGRVAQRRFKTG